MGPDIDGLVVNAEKWGGAEDSWVKVDAVACRDVGNKIGLPFFLFSEVSYEGVESLQCFHFDSDVINLDFVVFHI